MRISSWIAILVLCAGARVNGQEGAPSPTGPVVQNLQAALKAVKSEFGPGESLLLQWTLTNVGPNAQTVRVPRDRRVPQDVRFAGKRDGQALDLRRATERETEDAGYTELNLAPGETVKRWIDLGVMNWANSEWLKARGRYEVQVTFTPGAEAVSSGWARFDLAAPGRAVLDPAERERQAGIRALVLQLGAPDFQKREDAQRELVALGTAAVPLLKEALAEGKDPEVSLRARKVLELILHGPKPVPPPVLVPTPRPPVVRPLPPPVEPQPLPIEPGPIAPPEDEF